jgi:hypothetical protein
MSSIRLRGGIMEKKTWALLILAFLALMGFIAYLVGKKD